MIPQFLSQLQMIPSLVQYQHHLQNTLSVKGCKKKVHLVATTQTDYHPGEEIKLMNNYELCNLVRDLTLTKGQAELLGS